MKTTVLGALGALITLGVCSTGTSAMPYPPSMTEYYHGQNVQKAATVTIAVLLAVLFAAVSGGAIIERLTS